MNGVLSLDDVTSNDGSSNDSENNSSSDDSDDYAGLREACELIGADFDHAKLYVESGGGDADDLEDYARTIANDESAMELAEEYRQGSDVNRMIQNWLRGHDNDFTEYTGQFYGASDGSDPGTYNEVQQRARDHDNVNLIWYKALFPEPQAEYWDSDPVLWHKFDAIGYDDGEQDTHIYVSREFVDEYGDFTIEIDGESRPVPPWNDVIGQAGSSSSESVEQDSDDLQQISGIGVQFEQKLNDKGIHTLEGLAMADPEKVADHVGGVGAGTVRDWQSQIDAEPSDTSDESDSEQVSLDDISGDVSDVKELLDEGFTKDEIMQLLG